jgi:hypothetical protein
MRVSLTLLAIHYVVAPEPVAEPAIRQVVPDPGARVKQDFFPG